MPPEGLGRVWEEIDRLRDWRHNHAEPRISSLEHRYELVMAKLDDIAASLVGSDERVADAVVVKLDRRRRQHWLGALSWPRRAAVYISATAGALAVAAASVVTLARALGLN